MAKSTSIQNSTWFTLLIAAAALLYFAYASKPAPQKIATETPNKTQAAPNIKQEEVNALGELSPPVQSVTVREPTINGDAIGTGSEITLEPQQQQIPPEILSEVGIDPNNIPEDLPEDLKQQLKNPPPLPADLKAQLESPPPQIPADIQRALETAPKEVTVEEVNTPPDLK